MGDRAGRRCNRDQPDERTDGGAPKPEARTLPASIVAGLDQGRMVGQAVAPVVVHVIRPWIVGVNGLLAPT